MTAAFAVVNLPIVWTLPRAWRERHTAGSGDTDLWLWLLSAALSVAVGLRFFGHYYLQLLPPLVLITTGVLMRSSGRAVKRTIALAAGIATIAAALGFLVRPFNEKAQYKPVSEYLKERAGPEDAYRVGHVPRSTGHPATTGDASSRQVPLRVGARRPGTTPTSRTPRRAHGSCSSRTSPPTRRRTSWTRRTRAFAVRSTTRSPGTRP
jgi:4-amino-4-deoxy-L-arabinose transferase-like glycosyltransferase